MSMNEPIKDMKDENEFDTNWNRSQSGVANAANANYGNATQTTANLGDPYGMGANYYSASMFPYTASDHHNTAWSNGTTPDMTFLTGYGSTTDGTGHHAHSQHGHQPHTAPHSGHSHPSTGHYMDAIFGYNNFNPFFPSATQTANTTGNDHFWNKQIGLPMPANPYRNVHEEPSYYQRDTYGDSFNQGVLKHVETRLNALTLNHIKSNDQYNSGKNLGAFFAPTNSLEGKRIESNSSANSSNIVGQAKKPSWASVASQPAKPQPKSLKSKMAATATVLSSKHMPAPNPAGIDSIGTWESKNGASLGVKSVPASSSVSNSHSLSSQHSMISGRSSNPIPSTNSNSGAGAGLGSGPAGGSNSNSNWNSSHGNHKNVNRSGGANMITFGPPLIRISKSNTSSANRRCGERGGMNSVSNPHHHQSQHHHNQQHNQHHNQQQQQHQQQPQQSQQSQQQQQPQQLQHHQQQQQHHSQHVSLSSKTGTVSQSVNSNSHQSQKEQSSPNSISDNISYPSHQVLDRLRLENNYNPKEFDLNPKDARFFIIKSFSEDDIHRSIKYSIWCSTEYGNRRLDSAFKSQEAISSPVFLFFSVNASGHFCGMAQMVSYVDYNASSDVWAQNKWKGKFKVKWIYVKDVPNSILRSIRLENNENRPVTHSRDTQEVPFEKGKAVLKIMHNYRHTTSIFDDFLHYEKKQEEELARRFGNNNLESNSSQPRLNPPSNSNKSKKHPNWSKEQ